MEQISSQKHIVFKVGCGLPRQLVGPKMLSFENIWLTQCTASFFPSGEGQWGEDALPRWSHIPELTVLRSLVLQDQEPWQELLSSKGDINYHLSPCLGQFSWNVANIGFFCWDVRFLSYFSTWKLWWSLSSEGKKLGAVGLNPSSVTY